MRPAWTGCRRERSAPARTPPAGPDRPAGTRRSCPPRPSGRARRAPLRAQHGEQASSSCRAGCAAWAAGRWRRAARRHARRRAAGRRRPSGSGTSCTPSRAAMPRTTGYVSASTPSRPPSGTSAETAAAIACLPLPANSTPSGSGAQLVRARRAAAAARAAGVPVTVAAVREAPSTPGRSNPSRIGASIAPCCGSTGMFISRSTRPAAAGSASARPGAGGAARTKVPRPTSPVTRPRRTNSAYTRAAVDTAMPRSRANRRWVGSRSPGRSRPARMSAATESASVR